MNTSAALLWEQPGHLEVEDVELESPRQGEVLVRMGASGICHSDDHFLTGNTPLEHFPFCPGHEGAGIVEEVGPGVSRLAPGDHVVTTFIPVCGFCRWCSTGMSYLCDRGAAIFSGSQLDGTFRMFARGQHVGQLAAISTFARHSIMPQDSCVKIPSDVPFTSACLVGCGVPTGWGSSVNAGAVQPGDVVVVIGVGGVGMNAVQGARHGAASRIVAVDPELRRREVAPAFGATDCFPSIEEATDLVRSLTNGQGADVAIVTTGILTPQNVADAVAAVRKAGTVVMTGSPNRNEVGLPINLFEMVMYHKRIQGTLYGATQPHRDIPRLVELYRNGQLLLDELVTKTYALEDITCGFDDLHSGANIRGVIDYSRS